jgi:hypothetical protein
MCILPGHVKSVLESGLINIVFLFLLNFKQISLEDWFFIDYQPLPPGFRPPAYPVLIISPPGLFLPFPSAISASSCSREERQPGKLQSFVPKSC